jgi:hypothetical protein
MTKPLSTQNLTFRRRLLIAAAVIPFYACAADVGDPAARVEPPGEEIAAKVAADSSDPDGLITPDFGSSFLPPEIMELGGIASQLAGYYSSAKQAFEVGLALGQALGIFDKQDPNAQFNKLTNTILQSARAVDWKNTMLFISSHWGDAMWAIERIPRTGGTLPEGGNEDLASGSAVNALTDPLDSAFMRPPNDAATDGVWKRAIPDRAGPDSSGLVYDWRLGAPWMLQLIGMRLHVIAALDPNFKWDNRYDDEMIRLRATVQRHRDRMLNGIKCANQLVAGTSLGIGRVCADIYTGAYAIDSGGVWQRFPTDAESREILQRLKGQVMRTMPLFEMQQMIDTLTLYIDGTKDLSVATGEIRLSGAPDKCLDVQWSNPNPGTPAWIWDCNGTNAQWWTYDRPTGKIYNPAFNVCLDALPRSGQFSGQLAPVQGLKVGSGIFTNTCDGTYGQKWTYDPDGEGLVNGFGFGLNAVTVVPNPAPVAGASLSLVATPVAGLVGQHFLAVQQSNETHQPDEVAIGPAGTDMDYFWCASENGVCNLGTPRYMAFGANGSYLFKQLSGAVSCTAATFGGDPAYGVVKNCYYSNYGTDGTGPALLAAENQTATVNGNVAYGANGAFYFKTISGTFTCDNATFGDPIYGVPKACYLGAPLYTRVTGEGGTLTGLSNTPVAYGGGGRFSYRILSGTQVCNAGTFGNPGNHIAKDCYVLTNAGEPTTGPLAFLADEGQTWSIPTGAPHGSLVLYGSGRTGNFDLAGYPAAQGPCSNQSFPEPDYGYFKHCWGVPFK